MIKRIMIPFLVIILLIVAYFVYLGIYKPNGVEKDTEQVVESEPINIDDLEGVEISYIPPEDPGIKIPSLNRETSGLTEKTQKNLDDLVKILEADHLDIDSWIAIGNIWQSGGNYEAAIEAWEYAYALAPLEELSMINLGGLYFRYIKNYEKAEESYKKALEINSKYPPLYYNIAELYLYGMKDRTKAIEIAEMGLRELPSDASLLSLRDVLKSGGSI